MSNSIDDRVLDNDNRMKSIISIDAGRKYISIDELKSIVDKAYADGYTGMGLILGNDGLRYLLDDMTITINNITYLSENVKKGILEGNKEYYDDPNGNALTQTQMDELIKYAANKSFEIIPSINSPGHMDAIIYAMKDLNISNPEFKKSKRTIDLDNEKAVNFTQAFITKYIEYFSSSCQIFNIGLDEYANDEQSMGGWGAIQKSGTYEKFVNYANNLATIVKRNGMQPMAFNDGIYYNNKDCFGTFDKDIIIAYWTSGWSGYNVANANMLVEKGHKILNMNDSWYWVLGRMTKRDGNYNYDQAKKNISIVPFTKVAGSKNTIPIIGCVQSVWADTPRSELILKYLFELMDDFSQKHSDYLIKPKI